METPAIVAVGYNRPDSMKRLLDSLEKASYPENVELIISIDRSDRTEEVEAVAEGFVWTHGTKTIRTFAERQGLRNHIIQCGDLSKKYKAVIILEDDLVVSPSFYYYTSQAIEQYKDCSSVAGIALYSHSWNGYANIHFTPDRNEFDSYFGQFSITWGQCWTCEQWVKFKEWYQVHEGKLPEINYDMPLRISRWSKQSWGKYFISYMVECEKYYVIPYSAMSTNFSEVGQHNSFVDSAHQVPLLNGVKKEYYFPDFEKGIKYDVFFERVFPNEFSIAGISFSDVCVNLNNTKNHTNNNKYLLSCESLNYPIIASFGLRMRPIDANIENCVSGNDIKLYKLPENNTSLDPDNKTLSKCRASFELYGFYWKVLLQEGVVRLKRSVSRRLKKK